MTNKANRYKWWVIAAICIIVLFAVFIGIKTKTQQSYILEDGKILDEQSNCWIKISFYDAEENSKDIEFVKTWGKMAGPEVLDKLETINKIAQLSIGNEWKVKTVLLQTGYNIENCYLVYAYKLDNSLGLMIEYDLSMHERKRM